MSKKFKGLEQLFTLFLRMYKNLKECPKESNVNYRM